MVKTYNFSVWIKVIGINFYFFAINVYLPTRWNTKGPNIPSFHCFIIPIVSEANNVRVMIRPPK